MSEVSLHPFGSEAQNTQVALVQKPPRAEVEAHTTYSASPLLFIPTVEQSVCDEINRHRWVTRNVRQLTVKREDLKSHRYTAAHVKARHWVWWVLHYHPFVKDASHRKLAKSYGYTHKTVTYGIHRVNKLFDEDPYGRESNALRSVCLDLIPNFGFFDPDKREGERAAD